MVKGCYPHTQPPSWRTTPCCLSAAAYSMYSQLTYLEAVPRMRHAVVTGTGTYICELQEFSKSSYQYKSCICSLTCDNRKLHSVISQNAVVTIAAAMRIKLHGRDEK
jgi:hypothetical protein